MDTELRVGMKIPVFGQQLSGHYIRNEDGRCEPHFAVPGWYVIEEIKGPVIVIRKGNYDRFVTHEDFINAVLFINLECVAGGMNP